MGTPSGGEPRGGNTPRSGDDHVFHHDAENLPTGDHHVGQTVGEAVVRDYWRANVTTLAWLLAIWFLASFGCGILFVDQLNAIPLGGFKLGFWFAQQGAIYVFLALILVYIWRMGRIEHRLGVDDD